MGLVEDEGVVAQQASVALDLGEQDAVGHQLDQRAVAGLVGEAHRVADGVAERGGQFVGDALSDGAGGEPARLGVPDCAADATAELQADLRQLGGLARTGLAGDDDDLVFGDRPRDLVTRVADRQVGVGDRGDRGLAGRDERLGGGELFGDLLELLGAGLATQILNATAEPGGVADRQPVEAVSQFPQLGDGRLGHSGQVSPCRATSSRASPRTFRRRAPTRRTPPRDGCSAGNRGRRRRRSRACTGRSSACASARGRSPPAA